MKKYKIDYTVYYGKNDSKWMVIQTLEMANSFAKSVKSDCIIQNVHVPINPW